MGAIFLQLILEKFFCDCCSKPPFGSLISVGDTSQGDLALWVVVGGGLQDQVTERSVSVGVTASSASVAQLPGAWLIMKMKWREAERLVGSAHPVAGPRGAYLGVIMHSPLPLLSPQALLVPGLRQTGLLTIRGCLSGWAARAGDREDGVDCDTINLII